MDHPEVEMTTENSTNAPGNTLVSKLNALIDAELNPEQVSMELPAVLGQLLASRKTYDLFTTRSNMFKWMADAYTATIVGPLAKDLLRLHQYLVAQGATASAPHDFEHSDRYGAVFMDAEWKSMALMTQSYTYMVVLQPTPIFIEEGQGSLKVQDGWTIHIRMCTTGPNSQDYARPEFSSLSFLADFDRVYPEVGYGQNAHSYFKYKDGRDQGYLCSVVPDMSGQGYTTQDSLWGSAFTYLGGVLFDLGCHCAEIP